MSKRLINGMEAVALAAIEGGANVFTGASHTPCISIVHEARRQKSKVGIASLRTQVTVDPRSAFEAASMAAIGDARAVWACTQSELYACSDELIALRRFKMAGALVIIACCDPKDPLARAGSDIRRFAQFAKMPLFDPADPKQAMAMIKAALELSDEYEIPVVVNLSTLIAGTSMFFEVDPASLAQVPMRPNFNDVYLKNASLDEKIHKIGHALSYDQKLIGFNRIYDRASASSKGKEVPVTLGIACAGSGVPFMAQALQVITQVAISNGVPLPAYRVLQVCTPYPYPKRAVFRFVRGLTNILVIEGPDTIIENGMLKDSATNFLAPKLRSIPAASNIGQVRMLAMGIAKFFDACAGPRPVNPYSTMQLEPLVAAFFKGATVYRCSLNLPPRDPSRYDDPVFAMAFESFMQAIGRLHVSPDKIAISGLPHYMAYDNETNSICSEFMQAPRPIERASFDERLSWLKLVVSQTRDLRGVIFADIREVLVDGLTSIMDVIRSNDDITLIVVDANDDSRLPKIDIAELFKALDAGVVCCDEPYDPSQSKKACMDALVMRGVSFALLVSGLTPAEPDEDQFDEDATQDAEEGNAATAVAAIDADDQEEEADVEAEAADSEAADGEIGDDDEEDIYEAVPEEIRPASIYDDEPSDEDLLMAERKRAEEVEQSKKKPGIPLEGIVAEDMTINGADPSVPKSTTFDVSDDDGEDFSVSIQNIVQSFDLGGIEINSTASGLSDEPYLTLQSLEDGPESPSSGADPTGHADHAYHADHADLGDPTDHADSDADAPRVRRATKATKATKAAKAKAESAATAKATAKGRRAAR